MLAANVVFTYYLQIFPGFGPTPQLMKCLTDGLLSLRSHFQVCRLIFEGINWNHITHRSQLWNWRVKYDHRHSNFSASCSASQCHKPHLLGLSSCKHFTLYEGQQTSKPVCVCVCVCVTTHSETLLDSDCHKQHYVTSCLAYVPLASVSHNNLSLERCETGSLRLFSIFYHNWVQFKFVLLSGKKSGCLWH